MADKLEDTGYQGPLTYWINYDPETSYSAATHVLAYGACAPVAVLCALGLRANYRSLHEYYIFTFLVDMITRVSNKRPAEISQV